MCLFGVPTQLTHELPVVGTEISSTSISIPNLLCLLSSPTITSRSWKSPAKMLSGKHTNQVNPFAFLVIPVHYLLLAFTAAAFSSLGSLCMHPALLLSLPSLRGLWQSLLIKTPLFCTTSPHPLPLHLHLSCLSLTVNSPEQGTCFLQICTKACKFTAL